MNSREKISSDFLISSVPDLCFLFLFLPACLLCGEVFDVVESKHRSRFASVTRGAFATTDQAIRLRPKKSEVIFFLKLASHWHFNAIPALYSNPVLDRCVAREIPNAVDSIA